MLWRWGIRTLLVICLFGVLEVPGRAEPSGWRIGPRGPFEIVDVAPSPTWETDGVILALRERESSRRDLTRTRDGGQSWQLVTLPNSEGARPAIWYVQGPSGRIAFYRAGKGDKGRLTLDFVLSRSTDDGDTWAEIFKDRGYRLTLAFSPTFATDGLVFLLSDRQLLRSADAGLTWTPVALAGEKGTEAIAFSPAFGTDRTIMASIAAIGTRESPIVHPGTNEPDTEAGLLISSDAGATWSPIPLPSQAGKVYPRVTQMVISPSFADDGTLFVEALDGWAQPFMEPAPNAAVFRSTDRGLRWEMIVPPIGVVPEHKRYQTMVQLALSPSFAEDQTVLLGTRAESDAEHRDGQCWVQRSADAGTTWSEKQPIEPIEGCGTLGIWRGTYWTVAVSARSVSSDLGLSWQPIDRPPDTQVTVIRPSPTVSRDGVVFVGLTHGGIIAFGADTLPVSGRLDCAVPLDDEVARVFDTDPWMRDRLGCPTGPAFERTFVERRGKVNGRDARGIAPEGFAPGGRGSDFRQIFTTRRDGTPYWTTALDVSFQVDAERTIPGLVQGFDDGFAYILHDPGQPVEIVFGTGSILGGLYRRIVVPD